MQDHTYIKFVYLAVTNFSRSSCVAHIFLFNIHHLLCQRISFIVSDRRLPFSVLQKLSTENEVESNSPTTFDASARSLSLSLVSRCFQEENSYICLR